MAQLDLSVIILSYNTKDITLRCLEKLKISKSYCEKRLKNKIEVLIIDNASNDGSSQAIKDGHKWAKLLALKENTGFSKGCNLGMMKTKNPFILLLNSDVYLEEDSIYKALAYFRVNVNCDVLGARLNYSDGRLQPSAGYLPTPLSSIFWIFGVSNIPLIGRFTKPFHPAYASFFSKAHQVGWVAGAFFMLKREIFEKTAGFDENLFLYMEEVEWCKRIRDKGFKVWFVPQVEVIHLHGASSQFDLKGQYVGELKGIKYYLNKHYQNFYLLVKLFLILGLILRIIAFSILGKHQRARIYLEGLSVV